jgi:hypothetical protein
LFREGFGISEIGAGLLMLAGVAVVVVAVVLVVNVQVLVLERRVGVDVLVSLADQDRDAGEHEQPGADLRDAEALAEQERAGDGPDEGCGGEQGRLARGAEQA